MNVRTEQTMPKENGKLLKVFEDVPIISVSGLNTLWLRYYFWGFEVNNAEKN